MKTINPRPFIKYLVYKFFWTTDFHRRIEWPIIIKWARPQKNERILDVACGDGALSLKVAEYSGTVYGIDTSETAINEAKLLSHKLGIYSNFTVANAEDIPYSNNFFDKIICSSSLEHFGDDLKALSEMNRVLKPKGKLILTADSFTAPIGLKTKEKHMFVSQVVNFYTKVTLKERFERTGFETAKSRYVLNSAITGLFITGTVNLSGFAYALTSLVACPFVFLAEKATRNEDFGYTVIAEGIALTKNS